VGGGYSGIELACNLKDNYGDKVAVSLVHRGDRVMEVAEGHSRDTGVRRMASMGVKAMMRTGVDKVGSDFVTLKDAAGETRDESCDIVVWTAGVRASEQARGLGFSTTEEGKIKVTPRMRVVGEEGVYALGDIAECDDVLSDRTVATAQAALQQADAVAWNIHAAYTGGVPVNFRYHALGEMLSLGRAAASLASPLFGLSQKGRAAHLLRRATYLIRMPTSRHRNKVGQSWAQRLPAELIREAVGSVGQ